MKVPRTIQIRDLDDDVYEALRRRAAESGLTVPELLRREATRLAGRPTVEEWLSRTRRRPSNVERTQVIEALDELRVNGPMLIVDASCLYEVVADTLRAGDVRARLLQDR